MKILFYDLETSPILGYTWRNYKTDLLSIEKESGLLAFSYKVATFSDGKVDDGPVHNLSRRKSTEKQMVKKLWKLFDEHDVICAQNGDKFDMRVANRLFVRHKLKPPSPYKTVDTLKIARKNFKFDSNRLDDLGVFLLGESKHPTSLKLWMDCIKGDKKALQTMEEYCGQDVELLYKVYLKLRPWHTGHPNSNLYNQTTHACPVCGSKHVQRRGFNHTRVGLYQRYQCRSCGAWSQGEKVNKEKVIR